MKNWSKKLYSLILAHPKLNGRKNKKGYQSKELNLNKANRIELCS